jgi:ABC-2 type transport system ATP-binding protein
MDEAQHLADRLAIIAAGRIVAEGTPEDLLGRGGPQATITFRHPAPGEPLPDGLGASSLEGTRVTVTTAEPTQALHALTSWAVARGQELEELQVSRPTLEDVYLELVGEAATREVEP